MQDMQPTTPQLNLDLGMDQDMSAPEMGGQDMASPDMGLPNGEIDHEGAMAKADLYKLANYSFKLFKKIDDTDQLEAWVQAKITKAADYIASVYHYLEYEMEFSEYGRKIENSEMYNESQKRELKTRLLEAKEKIKELKKKQADKISGKPVEEHFAYDTPKKGGKGNPSKDKLAVRGGLSTPTGDPDGYKDMVKGTGSFGKKAKDIYGINGPKGKLPESTINELSRGKVQSYVNKAEKQIGDRRNEFDELGYDQAYERTPKEVKRLKHIKTAQNRLDKEYTPESAAKKSPKAKKDYDKDGKVESEKDEVIGSRRKAAGLDEGSADKKCNHSDKGKSCPVHGMKECSGMNEAKTKPSAGMTKKEKSTVVKKAKKGEDIGKPGKNFDVVAKKAGGGEKGKKIAAAAMWKNAKKKVTEGEGMGKIVRGIWVADPKGTVPAPSADQQKGSGITTPTKPSPSDRNNTMTFPKAPQPQKSPQPARLEESADLARIRVLSKRLNG